MIKNFLRRNVIVPTSRISISVDIICDSPYSYLNVLSIFPSLKNGCAATMILEKVAFAPIILPL